MISIQAQAETPVTYTFGNTAVGTLTNYFATDRDASRFQLIENGVLQSVTAYFKNSGFNAKVAVYSDSNGSPSTLIAQSNAETVTSSGWKIFTIPKTPLTQGYYWLCVVSSSSSSTGTMTASSTTSHVWKANTYSGDYPSTFGSLSGNEKTVTSIYATYIPANSQTPTTSPTLAPTVSPTPRPTATSTPKPTATPTLTPTTNPSIIPTATITPSSTPTFTPTSTPTPTPGPTATSTPKPTATPTPTPNTNNIATIPTFWASPWWGLYTQGMNQYPYTWQGHNNCIKLMRNPSYVSYVQHNGWMGLNELNGMINTQPVPVKPGDHIVYKAWIWTEASTVGGGGGCYLFTDVWGSGGRICELRGAQGSPSQSVERLIVPWGSHAWVQLTMDFTIKSSYPKDGGGTGYPTGIVPVLQLLNYVRYNEGASAYIYGTELYINPK
jgi:hypothetical protein